PCAPAVAACCSPRESKSSTFVAARPRPRPMRPVPRIDAVTSPFIRSIIRHWRRSSVSTIGSVRYDVEVRIGIDARKLHDFGIGTYIRNLLRQLSRLDHNTEFVLLCRREDGPALKSLGDNFRAVFETAGNYSIAEQLRIPLTLRRERVTLFHAPHYVLPPLVQCRSIVTIHDCIHLMFPQYLPNRFALSYAKASMAMAARRANRVLTVSETSKRDIMKFFGTPSEKIDVIYNAFDERFGGDPDQEAVVRVRERFQLGDPFVLYAGN